MFIVRNLRALINVPISKLASLVRPCALWDVEAMGYGNGTRRWREVGGKEVGTGQLRTPSQYTHHRLMSCIVKFSDICN